MPIASCIPVSKIRVGRHTVGIVSLGEAVQQVSRAGIEEQEAVVAALLERLEEDNYVPEEQRDDYEEAFWREYVRYEGGDVSPYFAEQEVTVRGEPGRAREAFVAMLGKVLAGFELRPVITFEPPEGEGPLPQLLVGDEVVIAGRTGQREMWRVLWKRLTDW